jgi:Domain of unknown function (DUF3786)/Putative Fe-S cluster
MNKITTPLELYKILPKTNCRQCKSATCMAFAAAVIKQEARLGDCPHLNKETVARCEGAIAGPVGMDGIREEQLKVLKKEFAAVDLPSRAELLGARSKGEALVVQCLGRDFEIDKHGNVMSQCHTHAWFLLPLFDYILHSKGREPSGKWAPLREMEKGKTWAPLFEQRCEKPLKTIADSYSELFADLVNLFSGTSSFNTFDSDVSVVLYPFPKVPVLICYWKPEDDIGSKLHLFFDDTAEKNLHIESLFTLGTGLVRMLEKIMHRHTDGKSELS